MFIAEFIKDRTLSARIDTTLSAPYPLSAGVPQGSVISPLLFLLMINDMPENLPIHIGVSLFADDCAIWTTGTDHNENHERVQEAMNITW